MNTLPLKAKEFTKALGLEFEANSGGGISAVSDAGREVHVYANGDEYLVWFGQLMATPCVNLCAVEEELRDRGII